MKSEMDSAPAASQQVIRHSCRDAIEIIRPGHFHMRTRSSILVFDDKAAAGRALMGWTPPDGIDVPKWRC